MIGKTPSRFVAALANGAVKTANLAARAVTLSKLALDVFNSATTVTLASDDKIVLADVSDSGNTKVALASDITGVVAQATDSAAGKVELLTEAEYETGTDTTRALTAAVARAKNIVYTTEKALTGTAVDFTDIAAWAKRITILFEAGSVNGTGQPIIQLGDAGGFEPTGYSGGAWQGGSGDTVAITSSGFCLVASLSAATTFSGAVVLQRFAGNRWVIMGGMGRLSDGGGCLVTGSKTLSGTLTSLRLTALGGNAYDSGNAILMVE